MVRRGSPLELVLNIDKNTLESNASASGSFITKFSAWAPGVESSGEWNEWALGKREISLSSAGPDLAFTEAKFRRRLSQISKMTVQVVHDLLPVAENSKIFFLSFWGELSRQFKINKMLIEDNDILPAAFSLSVFNAPAALASIAFGLKGGYSAIYPGNNSFISGLKLAEAALLYRESESAAEPEHAADSEEIIFIYADEEIPPEYREIFPGKHFPLAFAFLLSRKQNGSSIPLSSLITGTNTPEDFLKRLLLKKA